MTVDGWLVAVRQDVALARVGGGAALSWLAGADLSDPLAAEVWLYDADLTHVLLVRHRWRGWVPPGGRVEPGEMPRAAAERELFEESGVRPRLLARPAAASVRSYHPDWAPTLGLSYAAIGDRDAVLRAEPGQPASWMPLDSDWPSYFADEPDLIRGHARWLVVLC